MLIKRYSKGGVAVDLDKKDFKSPSSYFKAMSIDYGSEEYNRVRQDATSDDIGEYDFILSESMNENGGSPEEYRTLMDIIAYHESAHTFNPNIQQYTGPGRGVYQFEIGLKRAAHTALNRMKRLYKKAGRELPKFAKEGLKNPGKFDPSKLNLVEQDILFVANYMAHPKEPFKKIWSGEEDTGDFWAKYHQTEGKDTPQYKNFVRDQEKFLTEYADKISGGNMNFASTIKPTENSNIKPTENSDLKVPEIDRSWGGSGLIEPRGNYGSNLTVGQPATINNQSSARGQIDIPEDKEPAGITKALRDSGHTIFTPTWEVGAYNEIDGRTSPLAINGYLEKFKNNENPLNF